MPYSNYYRRPPVLDDPYFTRGDYSRVPNMGPPVVGPAVATPPDAAYATPNTPTNVPAETPPTPTRRGLGGLLSNVDLSDPKTLGLLSAAASLLESSGPSPVPIGLGQALGRAGMAGMGGYQQGQASLGMKQDRAENRALRNTELDLKKAQLAAMRARPTGDSRPEIIQALEAAGIPRERWAGIVSDKYTKPQTQINMNTAGEAESAKAIGKGMGEQYIGLQKSGEAATQKINRTDRLGELLKGLDTGILTSAARPFVLGAKSLGFRVDPKWSNIEAAEALSAEMALELRNPSGGAGMPGALSDKDREFLTAMVPGVNKTPQGRQLIMDTSRKLAQREREVAAMARAYRQQRGGRFDEGFYDVLAEYSAKNPLFEGLRPGAPTNSNSGSADPLGVR